MRRFSFSAALLVCFGLSTACAHGSTETADLATPEGAPAHSAELDESEPADDYDWGIEGGAAGSEDPNVISFEDEAGPAERVKAPPKREDIPGFQLFGTGPTESEPGPKLTLPPDME